MNKLEKFDKYIEEEYKKCSWISLYYGNIEKLLETLQEPKLYVEIGMAMGYHIETILQKFKNLNCYGVDPYIPYDPTDGFNIIQKIDESLSPVDNFNLFCESVNTRLSKYKNFKHIRQESSKAYSNFNDESIDLLFIDGNHTYEYVKTDCNLWWNKIKKGGIMCGDDYYMQGVRNAVNEFAEYNKLKLQFITKNNNYLTWYIIK